MIYAFSRGVALFLLLVLPTLSFAEDGYRLWLRYQPPSDPALVKAYREVINGWYIGESGPVADAVNAELRRALPALLDHAVAEASSPKGPRLLIGTFDSPALRTYRLVRNYPDCGPEGYVILRTGRKEPIVVAGRDAQGMLYGVFHFLRLLQTGQSVEALRIESTPRTRVRVLNHWDNLDRTVERGYAGFSLWDWHKLPDYIDPRYTDYARANASIGINGTVLTNVNANARVLTPDYLRKAAALADVFRPYGIRVYLTARFSAPMEIGGLETADPRDERVRKWWRDKVDEIYSFIPDFGGFTVKANSEGQPGPQNYGRSHAEGANVLADALQPHGGIVMWRAFVYDDKVPVDRTKQAYDEFHPLDGQFRDNVMVQVKNGPLDFQPREPFHPLFGAMPRTPLIMEFQITQEYLGFATHLVYLAPLFKEVLDADTHARGPGSTVGKVIDGSLDGRTFSGMAGVANIGTDRNWCGHPLAQANWYAFGRLAWDHTLTPERILDEWIPMSFNHDDQVLATLKEIMLPSREIAVRYMTPLGLHHIMGWSHHYGPAPWIADKHRDDWTSVYYHRADEKGIGFNRSSTGTDALEQYHPAVRAIYDDLDRCPEEYLLWFHHVDWDRKMRSGRTLWDELCHEYHAGADSVVWMQEQWQSLEGKIDAGRFAHVASFLQIQADEARWWRDACLSYFQTFSKRPIPAGLEKPAHSLEYYQSLEFPYAPGI